MKTFKKIVAILLAITAFACVCALTACGEKEPEQVTFEIEVVLPDGTPVEKAAVIVCDIETGICNAPLRTDANGKVSATFDTAIFEIHVEQLPEGYKCETKYTTEKKDGTYKFECVAE